MMHALPDKMPSICILNSSLCRTLLKKHCWDLLQMTQQNVRQEDLLRLRLVSLTPKDARSGLLRPVRRCLRPDRLSELPLNLLSPFLQLGKDVSGKVREHALQTGWGPRMTLQHSSCEQWS